MVNCKIDDQFLIKRRCQRRAPEPRVIDVGARFQIYFGRPDQITADNNERLLIKLAATIPGAFGAAEIHQTTRWSIEMIEKYYCGGRVLDVGCGAGLLTLCAARLAAAERFHGEIEAFDIYRDAVAQARVNLRLNGLARRVALRQAVLDDYPERAYQLVLANLPPVAISTMWRQLAQRLAAQGVLIISGILQHNLAEMRRRLIELGLIVRAAQATELWCLLVAQNIEQP